MRVVRFLALTFLFFLLLLAIQVFMLCVIFIIRMSSRHATGVGLVAGAWRELVWIVIPMVVVAGVTAWLFDRYWRRKSALRESGKRAPLL